MTRRKEGETDAGFARRLGVEQQYIYNFQRGGLSLGVLARIAERLPASDVVYVVTGVRNQISIDYLAGVRSGIQSAISAGRDALEDVEARMIESVTSPAGGDGPPGPPGGWEPGRPGEGGSS